MAKRPNILLIFTDQQRADTIGALGNPVIKTPNLDRIAREGVAFTNAFSPSPVCISARCSMLYGQYPLHTGCYENTPMPTDDRQSFVGALTEAGYRTHGVGKGHHSPNLLDLRGFQTREIQELFFKAPIREDYIEFLDAKGITHLTDPYGVRSEMYYVPQPSELPPELHHTQWVGDQSLAFLETQVGKDEPWFLFSSHIAPHPPFAPPSPWHRLYRAPLMPLPHLPQDYESLVTYVNRFQNRYKYRDQGIDLNLVRCIKAYYYAMISFVDYQVGRLLEFLERTGQLDNTLIIHTADHGELLGDFNCFGKRSMHDASARIPMLLRLPGHFEGGTVCTRPVNLVDIPDTVAAVSGASIASHETDGVDMAQILSGTSNREMVFSQHWDGPLATYMAVSERWKYFYSAPDNKEVLFDRLTDPTESRNRANVEFCYPARDKMKSALIDHLVQGGETIGIEDGDWKVFPKAEIPSDPDAGLLVQDNHWMPVHIPGYTE